MSLALQLPRSARQAAKSVALVACGAGHLGRRRFAGQGCALTFHGLREAGGSSGARDESLHLTEPVFRGLCASLRETASVMPLAEMVNRLDQGKALPENAVALTFDDGYASNFELAYPILRELGLPATIFLATGFIDREDSLWFQRVDLAVQSQEDLPGTLATLKELPDEEMRAKVAELEATAGLKAPGIADLPPVMRPMTWDQARDMKASGLVTFGAHTHTHPILSRCTPEHQCREIRRSRDRIAEELGAAPRLFAFPNGGPTDYTTETLAILAEEGFEASFTMMSGRMTGTQNRYERPRYGSPESSWEAEATVSGAFEWFKQWRQRCRIALGGRA